MYKYKIQSRFRSDKYTSEWLTVTHCKTQASAEARLQLENDRKHKFTEYRIVKI